MGEAFIVRRGGGGGGLNFRVIGGTSAPASLKENDIWVNTNQKITTYAFSATAPSAPLKGMVWFLTGTSSIVEFNALKKNSVQVYPLLAKQYISGAWVDKTAKSYQGGKWVNWVYELYLYNKGAISNAAGSLKQTGVKFSGNAGSCTLKQNASNVTIGTLSNSGALVYFTKQIDLTNYSTLYFNGSVELKHNQDLNNRCAIGVWKTIPTSSDTVDSTKANAVAAITGLRAGGTHQINVANCTGKHYVGIAVRGFGEQNDPYMLVTMNQMWLK